MRKIRLVCMALFAVLAFGAFAASSAFAEETAVLLGDEAELANESEVNTEGELELADTKAALGAEARVLCSGTLMGLWLPAELKLDVESVLSLAGVAVATSLTTGTPLECTAELGCANVTPTDVLLYVLNLPWLLDLILVGSPSRYFWVFLPGTVGGAQPGWELTCLVGGLTITDECLNTEGKEARSELQNMTPADLLGLFTRTELESEGRGGNCTLGGPGTGFLNGEGLTSGPGELALQVSG